MILKGNNMEIESFFTFFFVLTFIIPGFIFDTITRKITPQNKYDSHSSFLRFFTASSINYGLWFWLIFWMYQENFFVNHPFRASFIWTILIFLSPIIIGVIWGLSCKHRVIESFFANFGINFVNPIPTSWDYKFSQISSPIWILVRLKDGNFVAGYFGCNSFASSETNERDIYIEKIFQIDAQGSWISTKNNNDGIFISSDQIKSIEFFNNQEKLNNEV